MSRKDYILLATAIAAQRPLGFDHPELQNREAQLICGQWIMDREAIASALASDNSSFDRAHFVTVCNGEKALNSRPSRKNAEVSQ